MITFTLLDPQATEKQLGPLPSFLSEDDPRPAREQLDTAYAHGGGWRPFKSFRLQPDNTLTYPGDPPMKPWASARLRDETILVYPHDWVLILQKNRAFEACRMS